MNSNIKEIERGGGGLIRGGSVVKDGVRVKRLEYTTEELIEALRGTFGRWGIVAKRLGCSTTTAKERVFANEEANEAYMSEMDYLTDLGETVAITMAKSNDPQIAAQGANMILRRRGALARGWNGGVSVGGSVVETNTERKTVTTQDETGRMIILTEEKINVIAQMLKAETLDDDLNELT